MELAYTPEQEALRQEIRAYFAELMTPEVEAEVRPGGDGRTRVPRSRPQDGSRRVARPRLADGVRRPGRHRRRAVHLLQRVVAGERADPVPHDQHRRPHDHGVRVGGAEAASSSRRSRPASSTSRSATPSPTPAPTWPRSPPARTRTATSGGSTARRSTRRWPATPTTSGWPPAPTRTPRSTRASRSSWCPPAIPGSRTRRSPRW